MSTEISASKPLIPEVVLMRPIVIFLLVFYHAFIIYTGGWSEPAGFENVIVYEYLADLSYAFMLESFVFLSGYLFGYQQIVLDRYKSCDLLEGGGRLLISKFKRLIIPSVIFGSIYFACFYSYKTVLGTCYAILNGVGHLWFLPMLFWCFSLTWLLVYWQIKESRKVVLLLCAMVLMFLPLPLRLNVAFYYLPFFYAGFLCWEKRQTLYCRATPLTLSCLWCIFALLFFLKTFIVDSVEFSFFQDRYFDRCFILGIRMMCRIFCAGAGVAAFYMTALSVAHKRELPLWIQRIGSLCFGIYIFQQFILQILYYHTDVPVYLSPMFLPWVALIVTWIGSFCGVILLRKFRIGRFLLG